MIMYCDDYLLSHGKSSVLVVMHQRFLVVALLQVGVSDAAVQTGVDLSFVWKL